MFLLQKSATATTMVLCSDTYQSPSQEFDSGRRKNNNLNSKNYTKFLLFLEMLPTDKISLAFQAKSSFQL